jgi:hypothetical protein
MREEGGRAGSPAPALIQWQMRRTSQKAELKLRGYDAWDRARAAVLAGPAELKLRGYDGPEAGTGC